MLLQGGTMSGKKNHLLMPSQKKHAIEACIEHGIDPTKLIWKEVSSSETLTIQVSRLEYEGSEYYFYFDHGTTYMYDEYSPADELPSIRTSGFSNLRTRRENVTKWAEYLARELDASLFLEAVQKAPKLQQLAVHSQTAVMLTEDQQQFLSVRLEEIEDRIIEAREFAQDEMQIVKNQFHALQNQLDKTDRTSWYQMAIGALASILSSFFATEKAAELWAIAEQKLTSLFLSGPQ